METYFHYLPYCDEEKNLGMVCTTAGYIETPAGTCYPPQAQAHPRLFRQVAAGRTIPEFQIVYISEGSGDFAVNNDSQERRFKVNAGSCLFILPGLRHQYKPDAASGWKEFWVGFKGANFSRLLEAGVLTTEHVFFRTGQRDTLLHLFTEIVSEVREQKPLYQLKACSYIYSLLAEILSFACRAEQPGAYQKIVQRAKYQMRLHVESTLSVNSLAKKMNMSASRLNEIFKKYTSMTPYQYFIDIKINKAKALLEQKDVSVKETAFRLGFDDPYHFSRLFKNKTGRSPLRYQQHILAME